MLTILYSFGIRVFYLLALISSLFNKKSALWIKGRKGVFASLRENIDPKADYAWVHASSLGEFEQGRPIIEELKKEYPGIKIILTFFSPSGYEVRKNYDGADYICYLPLDTKKNARLFMKIVRPKWTFFVKYEYWYHFLKQASVSGSRIFLVSGIFREKQLFFRWYGAWYRKMLLFFEHLFVQNKISAELLEKINITNYTVSGDSRFDRVKQISEQSKTIEAAEKFSKGYFTLVCGSTWEPDEDILFMYLKNAPDNFKLIVAPHEIHKEHINSICQKLDSDYTLFSKASSQDKINDFKVLIIDNIGMLSSIYKYGQAAYIGGGFGVGIHNTLEAAVYGVPVVFGPNFQRFQEAKDLLEAGGSFSFNDYEEFKLIMDRLLSDAELLKKSGVASREYVDNMTGATGIVLDYLKES